MRVLHLFRNLKYGGNQALAYNIIKYSSPEFKHSILSLQDDLEMVQEFHDLGCSIKVIDHKEKSFGIFRADFRKYLKDNKIDVVVSWFYPYVLRLESDEVKFIHHVGTASTMRAFSNWMKSLVLISMHRKSKGKIIFASDHIKKQNKKVFGMDFKNAEVIHNGIDISRFRLKQSYDYNNKFSIVMVGRLDGSKDFDTLIKISPILANSIKNLSINIVGDGEDRSRLELLVSNYGASSIVSFLGRRPDVPEILYNSNLFVFLNRFLEGFGLALVEAMSCGLPVITYDIGANSEIIDDGIDGYLVSSQEELIEKINLVASSQDLAKELGKKARKKIIEKFDVKKMVEEYEKRY